MTTDTATTSGLMSLTDVAQLADVRRPVVSMWRKRYVGSARPFPAPVASVAGNEVFAFAEVVAWLEGTGRGNNRRVAAEAVLHGEPPITTPAAHVLCEALVTVAALSGESLAQLDPEDVMDLVAELDPHDRCLVSEVDAASDVELAALAPYADALFDSSFGGPDALDRLGAEGPRFGLAVDPWGLSPEVARFVLALAAALADPLRVAADWSPERGHGRSTRCPLVDPTGVSGLLLPLGDGGWPDGVALPVLPATSRPGSRAAAEPVRGHAAAVRSMWRRLLVADVDSRPLDDDPAGGAGPAVVVAAFPHAGAPAEDAESVLESIDEVVRKLTGEQCAIVLGPAGPMIDALGVSDAARMRDYLLRSGALRAAIRLGPGARPGRPQARMAIWVLGTPSDPRSGARRRTATADLDGLPLPDFADDVIADVLAAVEDHGMEVWGASVGITGQSARHVFRVARYELTSEVLSQSRAALVPRHARATRAPRASGPMTAPVLAGAVAHDLPGVRLSIDATASSLSRGAVATVAHLERAKRLRVVPGVRLAAGLVSAQAAGPVVVGAAELVGEAPLGGRQVDLLAFTAVHPRSPRTEAGDVVFTTAPHLAAWVDVRGGTVVEAPARALRVLSKPVDSLRDGRTRTVGADRRPPAGQKVEDWPQRILPRVLAADLLRAPGRAWRAATVRLIPAEAAADLAEALDAAHAAKEAAQQRARDLDTLTHHLVDGVVAGEFTTRLDRSGPRDLGQPTQEGR